MQKVRVKGPASYLSAIEAKYGRPLGFWFTTLAKLPGMKHMEMVGHLRLNHGMGHGQSNSIVAAYRSRER